MCVEKGFDPKALSELLGHADVSITMNRFVHSSAEMKKRYVSRLDLSAKTFRKIRIRAFQQIAKR